jgi:hypothetical protein
MTFQRLEDASSIQDPSARFAVLLCENGEGTDHWDPKMSQKRLANFSPNKQRTRRTLISSAKKKKNNFVEKEAPPRPKAVGFSAKRKRLTLISFSIAITRHTEREREGGRESECQWESVDRKNPSDRNSRGENSKRLQGQAITKSFKDDQGETRKQHNQ